MKKISGPKIYSPSMRYSYKKVLPFNLDEGTIKFLHTEILCHRTDSKVAILDKRIDERIVRISKDYDAKINKMIDRLIINNDLEKYSLENLNKLVTSIMRVTKSLSSSIASIVIGLEDKKW